MKIVIPFLSLLGLTFSLPVNQLGRPRATSNSKEILFQLMQRYKAMGNTPQQTQQRSKPGTILPPAKLVPDQNTLANQLPNEVIPFEWPFANFPMVFPQAPSELGAPTLQNTPAYNLQMVPIDMNNLLALLGALSLTQTIPAAGGGMTLPQQLLPPAMTPIILAQMGPQGAVLSSEEMQPRSQMFAGVLLPGMQGLSPSGQSGSFPEGQEGLLPAGQAGSNQGNLPFPEGTAGVTIPAGIQQVFPTTNDGLGEAESGPYPTPSGFRMPSAVTNEVFVEPTVSILMEPSELREPPTSAAGKVATYSVDKENIKMYQNLSQSLVRGDSHGPTNTMANKPLREP